MRNFFERLRFYLSRIPDYTTLNYIDKDSVVIDAKNITFGNMPWKKGWTKSFNSSDGDPFFRPSRPWNTSLSKPQNCYTEDGLIRLTFPKNQIKDAYMQSNFTIKIGTVKAVVKVPDVKYAWSAFWLFGEDGMPECDIMEYCGSWKDKVSVTHHWGYDYNNIRGKKMTHNNARTNRKFKPTENFYLYEVELTPYEVIYRINGIVVRKMKQGVPSGGNNIIFDVTQGNYCDNGIPTQDATMEIKQIIINKIS
jgi:beta-glucanase (GH16 family)